MAKLTYDRAIKAVILLILLVVFFFFFFWHVVVQYSEEITNTSKIVKKAELIEVPTFTICSGWKKSKFKEYKISPMIFSVPPGIDTNLPTNATVRTIFDDVVFKLNKDFVIGLSPILSTPMLLNVGSNEIKVKNSIYKFKVKEIPTQSYGMCYAIIPNGMFLRPYKETMYIAIARNVTADGKEMKKVTIQISSNDTYDTINQSISGMKNMKIERDLTSGYTNLGISYTEENTEYIKDCIDSSFFKRYAEKIKETESFDCNKKCVSLVLDSLMDSIEHTLPKCTDPIEKDEYCMLGIKGYEITSDLKSTCIKQCKYKGSTLDMMEIEQDPLFTLGKDMNSLSCQLKIHLFENHCSNLPNGKEFSKPISKNMLVLERQNKQD